MVNIIGQGTYGCVTKPSLKCDTPQDYTGRVSKLMVKYDAEDELAEMEKIAHIPNIDKYILRLPKICSPLNSKEFYDALNKCKINRIKSVVNKEPKKFRLLLLDDGGVDLHKFLHKNILKSLKSNDINIFLTAILHLIEGVSFFRNNNIIHHDIKLPNIVYNVKNSKIKFIDFGIMVRMSEFIQNSTNNKNTMAQSWQYFPQEFSCVNKDDYGKLYKCSPYRDKSYDVFINKAANTFDSYCLSFCLKTFFKTLIGEIKHIHNDFFQNASRLMEEYCETDIFKRNDDLNTLYSRYKELLKTYNIYNTSNPTPSSRSIELAEKYSINKITDYEAKKREESRPSVNSSLMNPLIALKLKKSRKTLKNKSIQKQAIKKQDIQKQDKPPCPPGKERNPKTGRCINIKNQVKSPCPPGKERNPKTRRCVNIKKTHEEKMNEPCPPGKERNPKTGRCIKTRKNRS